MIEKCIFCAEFVTMKIGVETIPRMCFELHMMGIPIDGTNHFHRDRISVVNNTSKLESLLKKKKYTVCYCTACESIAMGETLTAHINGNENSIDLLTKVIVWWNEKEFSK